MTDEFVPISARMTEIVKINLEILMTSELAERYHKRLVQALTAIEGEGPQDDDFDITTATLSELTARMFDRQESPIHELVYVSELEPDLVDHYNTFADADD